MAAMTGASDDEMRAAAPEEQWGEGVPSKPSEQLNVDVEGFEGPLDLLLELARRQKVDLARISILALAEQYLEYVEKARKLRIELAADYLVMAAWLAYLKSRLLLPEPDPDTDEPTGEELAAILAFRLQRLEAMRDAGRRLMNRNRLGRDFFARGAPEPMVVDRISEYSASMYDFLTVYAELQQKKLAQHVTIARREVWSLAEAREALMRVAGELTEWTSLDGFLERYLPQAGRGPASLPTAKASSFAAALELVREGRLALRQEKAYAPLYLRKVEKSASDQQRGE